MQTSLFENIQPNDFRQPALWQADVMRPCPYCKGTDLIITEAEYHGHTFYHLHHEDYHSGNRKCGLLVYDWDKQNLIEQYNTGFLHGA